MFILMTVLVVLTGIASGWMTSTAAVGALLLAAGAEILLDYTRRRD